MLGWVKVQELMVDVGDDIDYENADDAAAAIVTEILSADPRVHKLTLLRAETPIFHD